MEHPEQTPPEQPSIEPLPREVIPEQTVQTAPASAPQPADDVIVISRAVVYVFLSAIVFFVVGFGVAWLVFAGGAETAKNAADQAVRTAVAELVNGGPTPTAIPQQDVKFSPDSSSWGPADAKVTIVEYSDFQCPFCESFFQQTYPLIKQNYGDKIRFVFQFYPLTQIHPDADAAANAAACAKEQNKFWEYHDELFNNQSDLSHDALVKYAQSVKVADIKQFTTCLDAKKYESTIQSEIQAGSNYFVNGTPTFFVNGNILVGAQTYATFKTQIDYALAVAPGTAGTGS